MTVTKEALTGIDGVEHVRGNLYRVKRDLIQFAESGFDLESKYLKFGNPRYVRNSNGRLVGQGISRQEMDELRSQISEQGLQNPLLLRPSQDKLVLVNGERRLRCIMQLVKDKEEDCLNLETGDYDDAVVVYEYIDCRIQEMSDEEAFHYAFTGNDSAVPIGEIATLQFVRYLRGCGKSDREIMALTSKSITWLRETDTLLGKPEVLEALANEDINRKVALKLAKLESAEARLDRLSRLAEAASERVQKVQKKLEQDIERAKEQQELAEASVAVAEEMDGDVEGAQQTLGDIEQRIEDKQEQVDQLDEGTPTANEKDWQETRDEEDDPPKPYTAAKLKRFSQKELHDLDKQKGCDEEGNDLGLDLEDVKLAKLLIDTILGGKLEHGEPVKMKKVLAQHGRNKARRAKK